MTVSKLITSLQLLPHPEGGFYKETFRDESVHLSTSVLPPQYKVDRPVSTAIYFLLPSGNISKLHRIPSAEVWHFYAGESLTKIRGISRKEDEYIRHHAHIVHIDCDMATSMLPFLICILRVDTWIYRNLAFIVRVQGENRQWAGTGSPDQVMEIDDGGHVKHTILGPDLEAGQVLQLTVPPLVWFGAYPTKDVELVKDNGCSMVKAGTIRDPEHHFSLVGCTVAPAFQFEDFEMAKRSTLCSLFPHARDCIEFLTAADED